MQKSIKRMEFQGKLASCKVFTDTMEQSAIDQVKGILDSPAFADKKIRFMPDIHTGVGVPIGFTAELGDKIIPNVVGVDIGCGVTCFNMGPIILKENDFKELDKFIRNNIPYGLKARKKAELDLIEYTTQYLGIKSRPVKLDQKILKKYVVDSPFMLEIREVCNITKQDFDYALNSLGTLGGGNHFCEVDEDPITGEKYIIIHSGSRGFGLKVAKYYQNMASDYCSGVRAAKNITKEEIEQIKKECGKEKHLIHEKLNEFKEKNKIAVSKTLEYLEGDDYHAYAEAMQTAQKYARINRHIMGFMILNHFGIKPKKVEIIESIHNYINFDDRVIRKGAISAHAGEKLIIPLNMAEGCILGIGRGNEDWNNSAPHGAGRVYSRSQAKTNISMDAYRESMKNAGVWSSCINPDTLDESAFAYKKSTSIIDACQPSVEIIKIIKPIYNFKASE